MWKVRRWPGCLRCKCGFGDATEEHIFSGRCKFTRGLARARHNEVAAVIRRAVVSKCASSWSYIGEIDEAVPESLVHGGWKKFIHPVLEEDYSGRLVMVRHVKPDFVLADGFARDRKTIALVDFFVCRESNFEVGCDIKRNRYYPMCEGITASLGVGDHRVYVQPVPIGRNGVPHPEWLEVCAGLKIRVGVTALWTQTQQVVLSFAKTMFNTWQLRNGMLV
jgi:hypothetical protein